MIPANRFNPDRPGYHAPSTSSRPNRPPRHDREGYQERWAERSKQSSKCHRGSCGKATHAGPLKGPSHREPGLGEDDFTKLMTGYGRR